MTGGVDFRLCALTRLVWAVGNITGSNSVNVFLGLGLPWVIASLFYNAKGQHFCFPAGGLVASVGCFTVCAVLCLALVEARRRCYGGELGGHDRSRWAHFAILVGLWFGYVAFSTVSAGGEKKAPRCDKFVGQLL